MAEEELAQMRRKYAELQKENADLKKRKRDPYHYDLPEAEKKQYATCVQMVRALTTALDQLYLLDVSQMGMVANTFNLADKPTERGVDEKDKTVETKFRAVHARLDGIGSSIKSLLLDMLAVAEYRFRHAATSHKKALKEAEKKELAAAFETFKRKRAKIVHHYVDDEAEEVRADGHRGIARMAVRERKELDALPDFSGQMDVRG